MAKNFRIIFFKIKELISNCFFFIEKVNRTYNIDKLIKSKQLIVGNHTYGTSNLIIDTYKGSEVQVEIGKYCSLGPKIRIITGGIHPTNWVSTYPFRSMFNLPGKFSDGMPYSNGNIKIGNDVWIGTDVIILSGVTIGDGVVISTGSIVTKDIPPYGIVAGIPATILKFRFEDETINKLLEIKWWNWTEEKILINISRLSSPDLKDFIAENYFVNHD
jgi:acetyltransferase-like isoleucine patch superfamily enzyme